MSRWDGAKTHFCNPFQSFLSSESVGTQCKRPGMRRFPVFFGDDFRGCPNINKPQARCIGGRWPAESQGINAGVMLLHPDKSVFQVRGAAFKWLV